MTTKRKPRDESSLPRWAQELLRTQRLEIESLRVMAQAHEILTNRNWFVIAGQDVMEHFPRKLWWLSNDQPFPCCTLGIGDVLLVGRRKPEGEQK